MRLTGLHTQQTSCACKHTSPSPPLALLQHPIKARCTLQEPLLHSLPQHTRTHRRCIAERARHLIIPAAGFGGFGQKDKNKNKDPCPCGSSSPLESCCKPYLDSSNGSFLVHPPTAEACLRARYTAYKLKNAKLIVKTTSLDNPSRKGSLAEDGKIRTTLEQDVKASQSWFQFDALRILGQKCEESGEELIEMEVDVRQVFELETGSKIKNPPMQTIRETSCFVRDEEGRWVCRGSLESNWDRNKLQQKEAARS